MKVDQSPLRSLLRRKTEKQRKLTKSGVAEPAFLHFMGGHGSRGVGEELHHQVEGVLQMIKEMMNQMKRKMRRMILMKKPNQ